MSVTLAPPPFLQFLNPNNSGSPAVAFQLFTYQAGSSTKQATWTDSTQTVQNANPLPLDGNGVGSLWGDPGLAYKLVWAPANDTDPPTSPIRTIDNFYFPATIGALAATTNAPILASYARTAAEIAAGVTPTNYAYAPGVVDRYGTNTTPGTTDMTAAINNAIASASRGQANGLSPCVTFLSGTYAFSSDLVMPMGDPILLGGGTYAVTIQGQGKEQTVLKAISGGSFTHGLYFNGGSSYKNMGLLKDLQINGNGLLSDGITLSFAQMGRIENVNVRGCTGRAVYLNNCLMTRFSKMFITACGSGSVAQMEIDATLVGSTGGTTTTVLDQIWIEAGNVGCVAGLNIDRSFNTTFINGAIESTGIPVQISSKSATVGCNGVIFDGMDFEQPTTAYMALGFGLSGSNFITGLKVDTCTGESPGTIAEAVLMQQCAGARFVNNNWPIGGSMTSIYNLFGTSNTATTIEPHPAVNSASSTVPWVIVNGAQVRSAGPLGRWDQISSPGYPLLGTKQCTSAATWTPWVDGNSVNQGGWFSTLIAANIGAVTIPSMDGDPNMEVTIIGDGFTTLTQGTTGKAFDNVSGANFLLLANHFYRYRMNSAGTAWRQLGTA